ncbi:MAG: vitamin K epoxide reductase family protein [Bryobacteraceae bacterium]
MTGQASALGTGLSVDELRSQFQNSTDPDLRRRRAIILTSLFGMTSMALVTLLQTGVIRHLPDPPLESFDSDRVNTSDTAYALGTPDGALSLAGLAVNIPVAAFGGVSRVERTPYVPLAAAVKSGVEAVAAGWYFYQMPAKEKKWCAYCIAGAIANFTIFALTLPEAVKAWKHLRSN